MTSSPLPPDDRIEVPIVRLDPDLPPPAYARPGDAGADIVTAQDVDLAPGQRCLVGTGLAMAVPPGFAAFVHPRSGLAHRVGLSIVNAPGTIDSGYRGELKVVLINLDPVRPLRLARGDRIAQLVFQRVEHVRFVETAQLTDSERGAGGYGSTGGSAVLAAVVGPATGTGTDVGFAGAEGADTNEVGG